MRILRSFWVILFAMMPAVAGMAQSSQGQGVENSTLPSNLSPGVADIIKLADAGVSDNVIITYIDTSKKSFALSTDDIIALNNSKVSARVIDALLKHDGLIDAQPAEAAAAPLRAPAPLFDDSRSTIIETTPLPPPLVEVVPAAPVPWYIWRPGHWYWQSGWVWWRGRWVPPRPFATPVPVPVVPRQAVTPGPMPRPVPVPRPVPQPRPVIVAPR